MASTSQFNARNASASQIARDFVMPTYFPEVAEYRNIVLVGPRGIGKTTLLKALTAPGLTALHQREDLLDLLRPIDFDYIPIYIPAESIWKGTAGLVAKEVQSNQDRDLILGGLFTDHCLHQLISSFEEAAIPVESAERLKHPWQVMLSNAHEAQIAEKCSELWKLEKIQKSFLGIKLQLLQRSNIYRGAINAGNNSRTLDSVREIGHLDFLVMLKGFMDIAQTYCGVKRWTISFDEMEIAPKSILSHLYENLRSFDQRAALKFSLFPYVDFYEEQGGFIPNPSSPEDAQDFHPIILSSKFANPDYTFARSLIRSECDRRAVSYGAFRQYLNSSKAILPGSREFTDVGFERKPAKIYDYAVGQAGDLSLKQHLASKGIKEPQDIENLRGEARRAEIVRKVFPIAEIRSYYLVKTKDKKTPSRRASAKGYGYYHGFDQLLALAEGNPRAIKYYLNDLITDMIGGRESHRSQNAAIPMNVDRFRAMVASQAIPRDISGEDRSALKVLDAMGYALADGVLGDIFHPEPPLSFRIKNVHPSLKDALISAVNSGALVVEQNVSGKKLLFDLEGCRVRLSYRLAPFFKLPTISGQERILSGMPEVKGNMDSQPDLLTWAIADA
ncbi:hypothetical protein HFO91_09795 [Rhizobium leguminosarum]|uniref:ORC-CDC6 family AAA ATPase n=1 Tax=Rhizobium leguminosarum TaxID=384 RepID=UPI001C9801C2|nr:ATP-binding protein [Rhizobium leguminosarum]MBY5367401.1 hypothetical protein [Rhizobium leguminosarum]MBY5449953.1 hypothetical protein [Rhizobium leguminosarum]